MGNTIDNIIWGCIIKRLSDQETPASATRLDQWLTADAAHRQEYERIKEIWVLSRHLPEKPLGDFDKVRAMILVSDTTANVKMSAHMPKKGPVIIRRYAVAAVFAVALLFALLFRNRMFITSETGTRQAAWTVRRAEPGKILQVTLPDSSRVWLNSGSEISYPENHFGDSEGGLRQVKLGGEAFFEVSHDATHPFVVSGGGLNTTVYGTSFNVRAYENEQTVSVAVKTGKVGVRHEGSTRPAGMKKAQDVVFLTPAQQLTYNRKTGGLIEGSVRPEDVSAWTEGDLIFAQTPLYEVFATIGRRYGMAVQADPVRYRDCKLSARFGNKPLEAVMKTLKLAMNVDYQTKGQTIIISGGTACNTDN